MPSLALSRYATGVNNAVKVTAPREHGIEQTGLEVTVLFTTATETAEALKTASTLAADLNARINLIGVQVVPYPLPLERPPVYVEYLRDRLRAIADGVTIPVQIRLYIGRDAAETLTSVLPVGSIVVIGSNRRWWPTRPKTLARHLQRHGHQVVLTNGRRGLERCRPFLGQLAHQ